VPWEEVTIPLTDDLAIHAEMERVGRAVREFRIALQRLPPEGPPQWIVRYETHGGRAHKHERWDNATEEHHKHPKSWTGTPAQLVTKAIEDLQANFEHYEGRYEAWTQRNDAS
jgi:hypothetical protein